MRKLSVAEVLKGRLRAWERERDRDRESFERSQEFVRDVCEAGLVTDVEPTHGPMPLPSWACSHCGFVSQDEVFPAGCPTCGSIVWVVCR